MSSKELPRKGSHHHKLFIWQMIEKNVSEFLNCEASYFTVTKQANCQANFTACEIFTEINKYFNSVWCMLITCMTLWTWKLMRICLWYCCLYPSPTNETDTRTTSGQKGNVTFPVLAKNRSVWSRGGVGFYWCDWAMTKYSRTTWSQRSPSHPALQEQEK